MIYECDDYRAAAVCENHRLYDEYLHADRDETKYCEVCGSDNPEYFYCNSDEECIGCSECVFPVEWNDF